MQIWLTAAPPAAASSTRRWRCLRRARRNAVTRNAVIAGKDRHDRPHHGGARPVEAASQAAMSSSRPSECLGLSMRAKIVADAHARRGVSTGGSCVSRARKSSKGRRAGHGDCHGGIGTWGAAQWMLAQPIERRSGSAFEGRGDPMRRRPPRKLAIAALLHHVIASERGMTAIESPCILVCSIDMKTGYCFGCGRTRDEISGWLST